MLVMTSPVGATSGAKWGAMTMSFTGAGQHLAVGPPAGPRPRPPALNCAARARPGGDQPGVVLVVVEQPEQSRGPGRRVVGVDEHAGVADHLGQGGGVGGDHRAAPGHGLDDRGAEALEPGREAQAVGLAQEGGQVPPRDPAEAVDPALEAELGDGLADLALHLAPRRR